MIEQAIDALVSLGQEKVTSEIVFEGTDTITKLVNEGGAFVVKEFDRPDKSFDHVLDDLGSLQKFITGHQATVFINTRDVVADRNYGGHHVNRAKMPLVESDEWAALTELAKGVSQKILWRLLVTKLAGCVDDSLLLHIRSVKLSDDANAKAEISDVGSVSGAKARSLSVRTGAEEKTIPVDWTFNVRVWNQLSIAYGVNTRIEIDAEKGIFHFHPIRLCDVYDRAIADMENELTRDQVSVYRGRQ